MNNEYDEDFLDENEGPKKSGKITETSQPNPEEPQKKRGFSSPKAALCALFALLSGLLLGLGFAGFAVPIIFNQEPSPIFTYAGLGGGVVLFILAIVFGFLSKIEAKKKNQDPPRLGFVTSFFLSRLLTALSVIGLIAIFIFCLGASIFNPQNYFDSLAGISSDMLIYLASLVGYVAFPLFFLKIAYGALFEVFGYGASDAGNRRTLSFTAELFSLILGAWLGLFFLYGFNYYPGEWTGYYVFDGIGYVTAQSVGVPMLAQFTYWYMARTLLIFAILTGVNFIVRLVFFVRATKNKLAHGHLLLAKKRFLAFLFFFLGVALLIVGFVITGMNPMYPPEEYMFLGHTFEAVAGVLFWVGFALGTLAILGIFPFLVLSFFKFMKTEPVLPKKEEPALKGGSRDPLKRKKALQEAEEAAEQRPEKEELDDILQQKLSLSKVKYKPLASVFGVMMLFGMVSFSALIGVMAMRFGFGYTDQIYGLFFIVLIFASLLFLALAMAFGMFLKHRVDTGLKRLKVRFFDHPKLMKAFYVLPLIPLLVFLFFFALDATGEWAMGPDMVAPAYYGGYFLILFLAMLGWAIGYSISRSVINAKSLAARRGAFGLTAFLAAFFGYGVVGMIVAQNLGGAGFGSILPMRMNQIYTLIFVVALFAIFFFILEAILYSNYKKKGLARGEYPFFARSVLPLILMIIAGFALLVVGIIMYNAANSSSKQAEGTMGLAMCLLWPGITLVLTAFTCLIPLHVASKKTPEDPIDKDLDEEENKEDVVARDEYGALLEEGQEGEGATDMAADKGNVASSGIQVASPLEFARSLSRFFRANGLALEEKEAVRLSAFLSYSHLLYIKGLRKEEANEFLEVLSGFFESQYTLFEEKVDLATYFQTCFELTKDETAKPCFIAQYALGSRSFSEELKPLLPPLNDLSMPYNIEELGQASALPSNLYHIVFLADNDTGLEGVAEAFALASSFHLTLPTCEKDGEATPMPLTDYDFLSIATKATDRFYMGEDSWKKIDALSGFVSSMKEFTLMNDARNGVERTSAFLLSSMFEEENVFDEIMASCILPHIILHLDDLELIEGEKGLHVQTGIIFGDAPLRKSEAVFQSYQAELNRRKDGDAPAIEPESYQEPAFEEEPAFEQEPEQEPVEETQEAFEPSEEEYQEPISEPQEEASFDEVSEPAQEEASFEEEANEEVSEPVQEEETPAEDFSYEERGGEE